VGCILFRFAIPAERLVIAYNQQLALALARRGDVWRISRLDLSNRRAADLGVLSFEHFAAEYDGIAWSVATDRQIRVIDTARSLHTVLWQVHDLPGPVHAMSSNGHLEQLLLAREDQAMDLWCYSLPQRRLMRRGPVTLPDGQLNLLNPGGGIFSASLHEGGGGKPILSYSLFSSDLEVALPATDEYTLTLIQPSEEWLILGFEGASDSSMLWFISMAEGSTKAQLEWPSLSDVGLRSVASSWLVYDKRGRLLCLDTENGMVERLAVQ
jgi:hypothetical protein